jgi:S1/P1 Nuclease
VLPDYASCHLAPIATWADNIRRSHPWSSHMHYIGDKKDHPSQFCAFGENGWEDEQFNVLTAITNTTQWIEEKRAGEDNPLKFLVHFIGDSHMPLHLTGRARGGNDMKVKFDQRVTSEQLSQTRSQR